MPFVHQIRVRNVNEALPAGLRILTGFSAQSEESRNGIVRVLPGPAITIYDNPVERVLFSPERNANPFFHLFEAFWMLAGRNDLPWLAQFNKRFSTYSDDGGQTQPAAYGHRWINYFGYNQLDSVVQELTKDPNSRRAVLAMWDGGYGEGAGPSRPLHGDLERALAGSADIPCNTHCYFRVREGCLDMSVMCRSNDVLWGAYGANAVHFSVLLEFLAARLGLRVGAMYQFSFNFHYYVDAIGGDEGVWRITKDAEATDYYKISGLRPMPMFVEPERFIRELPTFMGWAAYAEHFDYSDGPIMVEPFLADVAMPMRRVWALHKAKDYAAAEALCGTIKAADWRIACQMWIQRMARKQEQNNVG